MPPTIAHGDVEERLQKEKTQWFSHLLEFPATRMDLFRIVFKTYFSKLHFSIFKLFHNYVLVITLEYFRAIFAMSVNMVEIH